MKIAQIILAIMGSATLLTCNQTKEKSSDIKQKTRSIFQKGKKGPAENFTGNAFNTPLIETDSVYNTVMGNVYFEPVARSNWHTHPAGQILIITGGVGYHQIEGKPIETVKKGDMVKCPPNVRHWHGASADVSLQQLNTEKGIINWQEPVTDEQYSTNNLKK